ncbi:PREDICTED: zinc finger MYM-type protein 1-like [Prunus mume]|uniref:Zinc finger MYM-type protein 1-like n=2 Tax=Prunus mume TaxID=102107 RepID=A0ABM0PU84_PRUMU|nr:PREDICTED: zinc finger MYM-type protein 1-like [Prunus mume]
MAIVLRFVDNDGFLRERFFDIVWVEDTTASTLQKEIKKVLDLHELCIDKMRGQGYDGASNMRGAWNGLQALFLRDCPYAYYVHCFAHQLQLALVSASKEVATIWLFFSSLNSIVNVIRASPKRHTELQVAQSMNIVELLIAVCTVLENIKEDGSTGSLRGEATGGYNAIRQFEFVFILHLLKEIMGLTDILCRELQHKSQDIVNAMNLVGTTKDVLGKLRLNGWETFIGKVDLFCKKHDIDMPDMNAQYKVGTGRSCQQKDNITVEHHYHFDIFNDAIDFQLAELNSRFSEGAMELLILSSALDPSDSFKSFNIDKICSLAERFYPQDFTPKELHILGCQLKLYEADVPHHPVLQNVSTLSELCRGLVATKRSKRYHLIDRLIRLVLTLPVSTATTERAFSAMKLVKTALRNKMENDFLADSMVVYIEKELADNINSDVITKDFNSLKDRRAQLQ